MTVADLFASALECHRAGNLEQAERAYHEILGVDPNHADANHLLGALALQQGQFELAATRIRRALGLNPNAGGYYSNLGVAYEGLGKWDDAFACFEKAVRVQPDCADAQCNLGKGLLQRGKTEQALAHIFKAIQLNPNLAEAHNQLGNAKAAEGKLDEALKSYEHAARLNPHLAEIWNNLGLAHERLDHLADAMRYYKKALQVNPGLTAAWNNLALIHMQQGQFESALSGFGEAIRRQSDFALAHWNRSVLRLLLGDYEQGWVEYEWRWVEHGYAQRGFAEPLWDGSNLGGKTILLHAEQGIGDALQFIRYAALVKSRDCKVIVECHAPLMRLLTRTEGIDQLAAWGSALPAFDVHCPLLSLPRIFQTTLANIPANVPYLHADAALVEYWRRELAPCKKFKVGFAWQGNVRFQGDRQRSISLAEFARLAEIEGVQLISLQKGGVAEQLRALPPHLGVMDLGSRIDEGAGPFMDTAAVMQSLDLVIVSDTSLAHLAGGLGVPFWVALNSVPDWRWLLHRQDSPWYPTGRLFRQAERGRWDDVFAAMSAELMAMAARQAF